jgi:hypothetical protein
MAGQLLSECEIVAAYRAEHPELTQDAEFAAWLASEYVPIAGGWQY